MKTTIFASILTIAILVMMPNISAINFQTTFQSNRSDIEQMYETNDKLIDSLEIAAIGTSNILKESILNVKNDYIDLLDSILSEKLDILNVLDLIDSNIIFKVIIRGIIIPVISLIPIILFPEPIAENPPLVRLSILMYMFFETFVILYPMIDSAADLIVEELCKYTNLNPDFLWSLIFNSIYIIDMTIILKIQKKLYS